jgi:hypothetical protein
MLALLSTIESSRTNKQIAKNRKEVAKPVHVRGNVLDLSGLFPGFVEPQWGEHQQNANHGCFGENIKEIIKMVA